MKITVLDADTLGKDLDLSPLSEVGEVEVYRNSRPEEVADRITDSDVVVINKVKLNAGNLSGARSLKLICIAATGYDNIDTVFCRENSIGLCNVPGYSTQSVAQLTVSMALALFTKLGEYNSYVRSGEYTAGGVANRLEPVYHEIYGKTWGIVGYGNIGRQVGRVAEALGCNVIYNRRSGGTPLDELVRRSDIISLHTPLNDGTRGIISREMLAEAKPDAVIINTARGAVCDEQAIADAIIEGKLGGFATDVYSAEPFGETHPMYRIKDLPNVILTPHMAWGAYEARVRCLDVIVSNIRSYLDGGNQNRVV